MARVVVGFNHNIKHRGKMYHIQTEDSGLENPQLTTHLFVGGNILASKKRSYAELLGADDLARTVRELMEAQHKEVLRNLINGVYDGVDAAHAQRGQVFQPGEIQDDGRTVTVHAASPAPEPPGPAWPAGVHRFFVTDAPARFLAVAGRFLGRPVEAAEHVDV